MVKLLKLGKSEEEIKDLENREGKLNKKTIKRYLFLDAHKTASFDDILKFENYYKVDGALWCRGPVVSGSWVSCRCGGGLACCGAYMVRENECETSWAMATGTIMTAETSRAPTTRMDTETVRAATTATRTLRAPVGSPQARANSSSLHRANNGPRSPRPTRSTRVARAMVNQASETETVEMEPNR